MKPPAAILLSVSSPLATLLLTPLLGAALSTVSVALAAAAAPSLVAAHAANILLSVPDPAGDATGDGSYILPDRPTISGSQLDLRLFKAENVGGKLRLSVSMGAVSNPWNAPSGFSGTVIDIFIKTAPGGFHQLSDLHLNVPGSSGWQEHYRFDGFSVQHFRAQLSSEQSTDVPTADVQQTSEVPQLSLQGTDFVIDTQLRAGNYSYWVTSSVYSPFSPSGVIQPGGDTSPSSLRSAHQGSPVPLDVLLSGDQTPVYASGVLSSVGQTRDLRALILLALSVVGLMLTSTLSIVAWRRYMNQRP